MGSWLQPATGTHPQVRCGSRDVVASPGLGSRNGGSQPFYGILYMV